MIEIMGYVFQYAVRWLSYRPTACRQKFGKYWTLRQAVDDIFNIYKTALRL